MTIGIGIESGNRGATGIVPVDPGRWVSDIGLARAVFEFLRFLWKCKRESVRLSKLRMKDKDTYYCEHVEHFEIQVDI